MNFAREEVLNTILSEPIARPALEDLKVTFLIFDPDKEEILKWIS